MLVYKATSPSGKYYIGITTLTLEKRIKSHKKDSKILDLPLYRAFKKYGIESFSWEVIDTATSKQELLQKERFYINKYNSKVDGYNCTLGGEGVFGYEHNSSTKSKLSSLSKKQWDNMSDSEKKHRVKNNLNYAGQNKIKVINEDGIIFQSLTECSEFYNVNITAIGYCIRNKCLLKSKHSISIYEEGKNPEIYSITVRALRSDIGKKKNPEHVHGKFVIDNSGVIHKTVTEASMYYKMSRKQVTRLLKSGKSSKNGRSFKYVSKCNS